MSESSGVGESQGAARANVSVRGARRGDLPRIWELLRGLAAYENWTEYVTGSEAGLGQALFGARPALEGLVAERAGRIVGYALHYPTYSSFRCRPMIWLEDLFVEEAARGAGIGAALLSALAKIAVERNCLRVGWHVLDWNAPSIEFYKRMGATPQGAGCLQYGFTDDRLRVLAAARGSKA